MEKYKVTFYPDNKTVEVAKDTTILNAAISAGVYIKSACGGDGVCGQCKVILKKGKVAVQPAGRLSPEEKQAGIHLACLSEVHGDLEVEIPPESKLDFEKLTTDAYSAAEEIEPPASIIKEGIFKHSPLATKIYLELPQPNLNDKISDLERLYRQLAKIKVPISQISLSNIKRLGELLRDSDWKVTATLAKKDGVTEIVHLESADTSGKNFGMCFDIGTTTISAQLVDLNSKHTLGAKAAYNKQASFGSDVITRIIYAREKDGLEKLHNAVAEEMNRMIQELIKEHNIDLNDVNCVVCAGNTTMIQLLLEIDPSYIRKEPYVPTANFLPVIRASEVEININPRGLLFCVPGVSSYVGGDVSAGVLSCGLNKAKNLSLLIDIGTNGEIVLGNKDFLVASAASAGPAFEGSGLSCGMRASAGAIEKVKINPKNFSVEYKTIGSARARGICGSGYIDIISEMLRTGLIDKLGRMKSGYNKEFIIVKKEEADSSADIIISEADIENIKRAKAAIYSAASALIRHMGFDFKDLKKIFIAGGFGTSIDIEKAITIGLLPGLNKSRFVFVGNSSLAGARQILLSEEAMEKAEKIAKKITYLELSVEPSYMDEYMAALFFPHTDLNRFPSIRH
jgi:uncharacterized 2Fe-2S/4Fe-4S cluster protein (DUF4445 family)